MAKKNKILTQIEYAATRISLGAMSLLPRSAAIRAGMLIMRAVSVLSGNLRRTGMRNLEIAFPEKTVEQRAAILRGTFDSLGRLLGELSHIPKLTGDSLAEMIDLDPDGNLEAAYRKVKAEGRGVLVTTAHLGNWELFVLSFAARFEPISYLARPLDNPKIDSLLNRLRERFGNTPINKTHSFNKAIRVLRHGGILGVLADVNAHPKEGVFVPFFGVPACTPSGAAMLAMRSNALIYPMFCVWDSTASRYKVVHGSALEPSNTGDRKQDIINTTARYTSEIEKLVRAYPDQWMWIHRRWKTRPPGEDPIY
ncbi:MAG: lysophospholipid acyltransferase family protein [Pyrinomonadaceae bacterium]